MSLAGAGRGIGYILGTLYHLGSPDNTPDHEKYYKKQVRKEKIFNKRMESLYGDAWEKIRDKRVVANHNRMIGR